MLASMTIKQRDEIYSVKKSDKRKTQQRQAVKACLLCASMNVS